MNTMYVPIYKGDGLLEYEERPIPRPDHTGDVLVKIEACGICGTDLNVLATPPAHKATPNIIIGHEGVGIVEEVGPGANDLRPGDRVVIAPRLTCGECQYCRYDLTLHGTFVGPNPFEQTIKLLESQRLQPSKLITHRVPLPELARGVDLMRSGRAMKVIVEN
jgi:threonine dehydrogenase-like Zn-dependent dehydrogenase